MQNKLITIALLTTALAAHAETFPMTNLPQGWTGSINVAQCAEGKCAGKGEVRLTLGKQTHTLPADFHEFSAPKAQGAAPLVNPITIDDFNFDGKDDVAVPRGHQGPYGSASYDIYVQTADGKLVRNADLTDLTDNYMGLPETDAKHKLMIVYGKSGAAIHYTEHYRPSAKGLQNVYSRVDTHNGCGAGKVKIAEKALLPNGQWRSTNRCLSDAQYDKLLERETAKR